MEKQLQKLILLKSKSARLLFYIDHMLLVIQENISHVKKFVIVHRAAKNRLHSGDQFHDTKRLGEIIICAHIQTFHFINFRGLCRHHNDRQFFRVCPSSQFPDNLKTVFIGQHNIKEDQIRQFFIHFLIKIPGTSKTVYLITTVFQCKHLDFQNILIIFHCIDQCHNRSLPFISHADCSHVNTAYSAFAAFRAYFLR